MPAAYYIRNEASFCFFNSSMSSIILPGTKGEQNPRHPKIEPGSRIAEPGGKKGKDHVHGKLGVEQITHGIASTLYRPHEEKGGPAENAPKQQDTHDAKIIKRIIKQGDSGQFFFRHINGEIHESWNQELKPCKSP